MNNFHKLNIQESAVLAVIVLLLYGYVAVDQVFIAESLRPIAITVIAFAAFYLFFIYVKPKEPMALSRSLGCVLGIIVSTISIIKHVLITFDISHKVFLILAIAIVVPFFVGMVYKGTRRG